MSHNLLSGWHLRRIRCVRHSRHRGEVRSAASHQGRRRESSACPPGSRMPSNRSCWRIATDLFPRTGRRMASISHRDGARSRKVLGVEPAWGRSRFGLEKARGDIFAERSFQNFAHPQTLRLEVFAAVRDGRCGCSRRASENLRASRGLHSRPCAVARFAHASISFVEPSPPSFGGIRSRDLRKHTWPPPPTNRLAPPFADDVGARRRGCWCCCR